MSEPHLILHKVRGQPAFDIAIRLLECTEADEAKGIVTLDEIWIIPTSGHRAYPCFTIPLKDMVWGLDMRQLPYEGFPWKDISDLPPIPLELPDHYACNDVLKPKPPARAVTTTDDFLV